MLLPDLRDANQAYLEWQVDPTNIGLLYIAALQLARYTPNPKYFSRVDDALSTHLGMTQKVGGEICTHINMLPHHKPSSSDLIPHANKLNEHGLNILPLGSNLSTVKAFLRGIYYIALLTDPTAQMKVKPARMVEILEANNGIYANFTRAGKTPKYVDIYTRAKMAIVQHINNNYRK